MVTIDECRHIEELSKLTFTDEERSKFIDDFNNIITFASAITDEKTNLDERAFAFVGISDLRDDILEEGLKQDEVLSNAPCKDEGCFEVPKIVY